MRRILAAIAFLTRFPVSPEPPFEAADVGRATLAFPLVGAGVGLIALAVRWALYPALPAPLVAVLVIGVAAVATGALHLDGLADMADGFGGGRTREDVLRIMRDHAIGSYGAVALILLVAAKVSALSALIAAGRADAYLVLAPALGRWASVPLSRWLPYARPEGGIGAALGDHVGRTELLGATVLAAALALGLAGGRGVCCLAAIAASSLVVGWLCRRRIGGVTGDTLGANTEIGEALVYVVALLPR